MSDTIHNGVCSIISLNIVNVELRYFHIHGYVALFNAFILGRSMTAFSYFIMALYDCGLHCLFYICV